MSGSKVAPGSLEGDKNSPTTPSKVRGEKQLAFNKQNAKTQQKGRRSTPPHGEESIVLATWIRENKLSTRRRGGGGASTTKL